VKGTNWALVPPLVVTETFTVPVPEGATAVIWVLLLTVNDVAVLAPNRTVTTEVKPVPVTMTLVPPDSDPWLGLIEETTGAAMAELLHTGLCIDDTCGHLGARRRG
jgi:hypothetical protein